VPQVHVPDSPCKADASRPILAVAQPETVLVAKTSPTNTDPGLMAQKRQCTIGNLESYAQVRENRRLVLQAAAEKCAICTIIVAVGKTKFEPVDVRNEGRYGGRNPNWSIVGLIKRLMDISQFRSLEAELTLES